MEPNNQNTNTNAMPVVPQPQGSPSVAQTNQTQNQQSGLVQQNTVTPSNAGNVQMQSNTMPMQNQQPVTGGTNQSQPIPGNYAQPTQQSQVPSNSTAEARNQVEKIGGLPNNQGELDKYLGIQPGSFENNEKQITPADLPPLPEEEESTTPPVQVKSRGGSILMNIIMLLFWVVLLLFTFTAGYLFGDETFELVDRNEAVRESINNTLNFELFPISGSIGEESESAEGCEPIRYSDDIYTDFEFTYDDCVWNLSRTASEDGVRVQLTSGDSLLTFSLDDRPVADVTPLCYNGSFVELGEEVVRYWDLSLQPEESVSLFNYTDGILVEGDDMYGNYAEDEDTFCTNPASFFITDAVTTEQTGENLRGTIVTTLESTSVEDIQSADAIVRTISY